MNKEDKKREMYEFPEFRIVTFSGRRRPVTASLKLSGDTEYEDDAIAGDNEGFDEEGGNW